MKRLVMMSLTLAAFVEFLRTLSTNSTLMMTTMMIMTMMMMAMVMMAMMIMTIMTLTCFPLIG